MSTGQTDGAAIGIFVKSPDVEGARIAASAGIDFAIIDLEHSMLDLSAAASLIGVFVDNGVEAIVRLPAPDSVVTGKVLECGAAAVQLSSVVSVAQVHETVEAVAYPPVGRRGVSFAHRQARWGLSDPAEYLATALRARVIVQIETATTIDSLEDILAAGADGVFIGVEDLRVDCRVAGVDFDARFDEVVRAADRAGISWGCPTTPAAVADLRRRGAQMLTIGADRAVYAQALSARLETARRSPRDEARQV